MKDDIKAWIRQAREGSDPVAQRLADEVERMDSVINKPEINDFVRGVLIEAAHQKDRWGPKHDDAKTPSDWFWLLGYVGGKLLAAAIAGKLNKARHHCITTAAVAYQWFHSMGSEGAPVRTAKRWTGVWDKEGREICAGDTVLVHPYVIGYSDFPDPDSGTVVWNFADNRWEVDTGLPEERLLLVGNRIIEVVFAEHHL